MFGWLASPPTFCRHAPRAAVSRRTRLITPRALIEMLPGLGSVLYFHAAANRAFPPALPQGLVVQRAFLPLLGAHKLTSISAVTDDGPREWCECVDALGRTQARWHLLPDTDYLGWDAMTASCVAHIAPPVETEPFRPDCASVVKFRLRRVGGLVLLERRDATVLSSLGSRIATSIARAEALMLQA
jgi:hypothetical protein